MERTKEQIKNNHEYLKMAARDFLEELKVLLKANVKVYNVHKGVKKRLINVSPLDFKYTLEDNKEKELIHKEWDELDFMLFRRSFFFSDGFIV